MKSERRPGFPGLFSAALLPVANLTLFGTLTIYLGNPDEFDAGYGSLLVIYLATALPIAAILAAAGLLMKGEARRRYLCILFAVGLLLWVQGAFLIWDYGPLDGHGIGWESFGPLFLLDLLLWIAGIAAAILLFRRLAPGVAFASWILILAQAGSLSWLLTATEEEIWTKEFKPKRDVPEEFFLYSSERNIVHIVMDAFQSDVFRELVEEAGLQEAFDGFVFFPENSAVARYTSLSMPAIFSGRIYDGSTTPERYYQEAMANGFPGALIESGYTVNLMPLMAMTESPHSRYFRVPNIYDGSELDLVRRNATFLLDVSLFRQSPHLLRKWVYNGNNWRLTPWLNDPETVRSFQQKRFFADYIERLETRETDPAYHFLHLWPPHPPFVTTRSGRYAGGVLPNTRENYKNEARPMLRLFVDFLDKLKSEGIYDDALIVLQADHGGGFEPDFIPGRLLGLLVVKPRGSRGPLRVSQAPTMASDVARTILDHEGIESSLPGRSVFGIDPGESRVRRHVFLGKREGRDLQVIRIDGSVYSADSYRETVTVELGETRAEYRYGDEIGFGLIGQGGPYLGAGWSTQSDRHCWSNAHRASLTLPIRPTEGDLLLTIQMIPHVDPDKLPLQRIDLLANGREAARWVAEERRRFRLEAVIPGEWIDSAELTLTFLLPDAASPAAIGTGGDRRLLGIALISVRLDELSPDRPDFKSGERSQRTVGFPPPESPASSNPARRDRAGTGRSRVCSSGDSKVLDQLSDAPSEVVGEVQEAVPHRIPFGRRQVDGLERRWV